MGEGFSISSLEFLPDRTDNRAMDMTISQRFVDLDGNPVEFCPEHMTEHQGRERAVPCITCNDVTLNVHGICDECIAIAIGMVA